MTNVRGIINVKGIINMAKIDSFSHELEAVDNETSRIVSEYPDGAYLELFMYNGYRPRPEVPVLTIATDGVETTITAKDWNGDEVARVKLTTAELLTKLLGAM